MVKMRSIEVLLDKCNAYTSCAEAHIYSQEDKIIIIMIILRRIFRKWDGDMEWIDQAQDRDRWLALVNAVMNLRVP